MDYRISSGQTSTGIKLGADDTMTILGHGTASKTTVVSGGMMKVKTGGSAIETYLNDGFMDTETGAFIQNLTIGSEGALYLSSKVSVDGIIMFSSAALHSGGGVAHVYSGAGKGVVFSVNHGGKVYVHSGGLFESSTVKSCNSAVISSGGIASCAECKTSGTLILSGGTAIDTEVSERGLLMISKGAVNSKALIGSGGSVIVKGGATYDDKLYGSMIVSSGGTAVRTILSAGSNFSTGVFFGSLTVLHGGVAREIQVETPAAVNILGVLSSASLITESFLTVSSGGRAYDVVAGTAGGSVWVYGQGLLSGAILKNSCELTVFSGGTAAGVSATYTNIYIQGGTLSSASLTNASCRIDGTAIGIGIGTNGYMDLNQGKASSCIVSNGYFYIFGGSAVQTTIRGGNVVVSGGIADGVGFDGVNSGLLSVSSNGSATNVSVATRGFAYVNNGGRVSGADVRGGTLVVSGGRAEDVRISSGFAILSHGILDTTVVSGGSLVASGGSLTGATVLIRILY